MCEDLFKEIKTRVLNFLKHGNSYYANLIFEENFRKKLHIDEQMKDSIDKTITLLKNLLVKQPKKVWTEKRLQERLHSWTEKSHIVKLMDCVDCFKDDHYDITFIHYANNYLENKFMAKKHLRLKAERKSCLTMCV